MKVTIDGRDFALTRTAARGSNLPKRFVGTVELVVNGAPESLRVTDNVAYAGSRADAIQYIWIYVEGKGAYYATLDYGVLASEYAGSTFDVAEGSGPKPPERAITREPGVSEERTWTEAERMRKFRETWAKRA